MRLYAGIDPVSKKHVYLRATVDGTQTKSWRKVESKLAEFQATADKQRSATSSVHLSYVLDEWMKATEIEDSTRKTYVCYIENTIKSARKPTRTQNRSSSVGELLHRATTLSNQVRPTPLH